MNTIPIEIQVEPNEYDVQIDGAIEIVPVELDTKIVLVGGEHYHGPYEFTPTNRQQVIPIGGQVADLNIVINPIPSNYGKVSWNGSFLKIV